MRKKRYAIIIILSFGIFLLLPQFPEKESLISVFRATDEPAVIVRGTSGSALTVNISFGDQEVESWIQDLNPPYPFLFIDVDWAKRFPETVKMINKKNIPVGLLGTSGADYEQNPTLITEQLKQFESFFDSKPLWFRTMDEVFPQTLRQTLWKEEVNALGSTIHWNGGAIPPVKEGEIISVSHHRSDRTPLTDIKQLYGERTFKPLEDVLFSTTVKTKKIPK
ncbi:hypothetical protein [Sporosarcina sp. HYO08]|uniref:hypothetical protein n=1 Tax=Sporosarcina sp. HYO08 TaxID=1759557 RepID=UPI00079467C0|nr:hypothetical protein [Sporosarcina sp. HYO08]KXH80838.1 hypothetical protein AU377_08870 [Sporosarcina sp. HYO08]